MNSDPDPMSRNNRGTMEEGLILGRTDRSNSLTIKFFKTAGGNMLYHAMQKQKAPERSMSESRVIE